MGIERTLRIIHRRLMVPGGAVDISSGNATGSESEITVRPGIVGVHGLKAGPERFAKRIRNVVEIANINIVQRLRRSGCRCVDKENRETPACRSRFCEKKRTSTTFNPDAPKKPTFKKPQSIRMTSNLPRLVNISFTTARKESSKAA